MQYVSILRRLSTQVLSVRCIFEMACRYEVEFQALIKRESAR
jgi:hypothetical protein